MFSLVAPSLSSLNRFSALIVQHGLAVQEGLVVHNRYAVQNGSDCFEWHSCEINRPA